jgi:hypothetical protein
MQAHGTTGRIGRDTSSCAVRPTPGAGVGSIAAPAGATRAMAASAGVQHHASALRRAGDDVACVRGVAAVVRIGAAPPAHARHGGARPQLRQAVASSRLPG